MTRYFRLRAVFRVQDDPVNHSQCKVTIWSPVYKKTDALQKAEAMREMDRLMAKHGVTRKELVRSDEHEVEVPK